MHESTALLTDQYELTMVDAALQSGTAHRKSVFELFSRRLPGARRYGVVCGTGRLLDAIERFRFTDAELGWLDSAGFLRAETLDWLANYRFSGTVTGYAEGDVFFPGSPILTVEASFAEGVILETLALSILNHDSAIATAASRMVTAAHGKPLAEMGSRRTAEHSAVAAARAAYLAGFAATSNLEAGRSYGIPTMGTAAHSFTLLHDTEADAFAAQIRAHGTGTTLLIDTFDIERGVRRAIDIAGPELGAVRIDSGDLPVVVGQVRAQLDALGAHNTKITVTNDLDEYTVAALASSPVDSFGVGTSVVTGSGSPTMGMVYKLVARQDDAGTWVPVAKRSSGKHSVGGRKTAHRQFNAAGVATAEVIAVDRTRPAGSTDAPAESAKSAASDPAAPDAASSAAATAAAGDGGRLDSLLVPLIVRGEVDRAHTGAAGLAAARARLAHKITELPPVAASLRRGDPAIPTEFVALGDSD